MSSIADIPLLSAAATALSRPIVARAGGRCAASAIKDFFFFQHRAAWFPGRVPVSSVDHPLDERIPFRPDWVRIYLDFVPFWIRTAGFLIKRYGKSAEQAAADFVDSMGLLYSFAGKVYRENLSTTRRPRYLKHPRFVLIHLTDPHLMCVPSLHVMIVIRCYTKFRDIARALGEEEALEPFIEELYRGALAITESILFVKQHSVNCISAAMYAMTRFDAELFPPEEAERFARDLYGDGAGLPEETGEAVRRHIHELYRRFMEEGERCDDWRRPLLDFLEEGRRGRTGNAGC